MNFIEVRVNLPVSFKEDSGWVVAECPVLDVVTQGRNYEEARQNLGDALQGFIASCLSRKVLEQVLSDCGFAPADPAEVLESPRDYMSINVPMAAPSRSLCHA